MKFKDPVDDERLRHFRRGLGFTNTDGETKPDTVVRSQPRMSISPDNGRIYGVFIDDDGKLKAGLVLADNTDWESTWFVSLIPSAHTGKMKNPFLAVDPLGNMCISYEYWPDNTNPEVWVYDERLVGSAVVPYLQKVTEGRSAVTIADRDEDLLIFYRKSDGTLCWRARSAPPYATVWDTENVITVTGLTGDLYIDDVFMIGGQDTWDAASIILCISKRGRDGRYALYYVRSVNWPRSIMPSESFIPASELSAINWIAIIEYIPEEQFVPDLYLQMINWIAVNEYESFETLICLSQISQITWSGGVSYTVSETATSDGRLVTVTWTSNNNVSSPDEGAVFTCEMTDITWTSV